MNTLFDSEEKAFIRDRQWADALYPLIESGQGTRILEFLGSRWEFWKNLREQYPEKNLTINGVTLDETVPGAAVYDRVFRGRYDELVQSSEFLNTFPYDLINLDYCGGGRMYDQNLRYFKLPEIKKTIEQNMAGSSHLRFLITFDAADDIYPIRKSSSDCIQNSPISDLVIKFLDSIKHLDTRVYWLMLIGNAFEIANYCTEQNLSLRLETEPYTYIAESIGHKSRMLCYSFTISKEPQDAREMYLALFEKTKQTFWVAKGEEFYNNRENYL